MAKIETRSNWSVSDMDWGQEWRALRRDTRRVCHPWIHHPGASAYRWLTACGRAFSFHENNNRFTKAIFLCFSAVAVALLLGQSAADWQLRPVLLAPIVATWLISVGVMLGFEVERIEVGGIQLQIDYDEEDE